MTSLTKLTHRLAPLAAIAALVAAMGGTWMTSRPAFAAPTQAPVTRSSASPPSPSPSAPRATASASASAGASDEERAPSRPVKKEVTGKLNLNTATEDQLMLLPTVGPSKAERVVVWRKKNGGFKRTADLRRVKGFGYRTFKRLEPFLDVKGETTLVARR